ncbi:MAG: 4Fe-4S binding protein [Desulfobacterales bacterium]|nr:4Fe-4S binding protein [Desulfobacterales bacterium]
MKWSQEAEEAVKKVPFFVRKKVRARVEKEAAQAGAAGVTLAHVKTTQARYLKNMSSEIKGYQIDTCFGHNGCSNRAVLSDDLVARVEARLFDADLIGFLKERVAGELKFHHEFRVTFADCPNACSQPQIKDMGIIGACLPMVTEATCTQCGACEAACREGAVTMNPEVPPTIDWKKCLACGQCMAACPTQTLEKGKSGFRLHLGGKLGRHPQLARELPGIFTEDEVMAVLNACLALYKEKSTHGQRFAELFTEADFQEFSKRFRT